MNSKTTHIGVIDSIKDNKIVVRVVQKSACASCQMASHCHAVESRDKLINVVMDASDLEVGDQVRVVIDSAIGYRALCWAMVLPLIFLVGTIILVRLIGCSELLAALYGVGILVPYYLVLRLMRNKIERTIFMSAEKIKD